MTLPWGNHSAENKILKQDNKDKSHIDTTQVVPYVDSRPIPIKTTKHETITGSHFVEPSQDEQGWTLVTNKRYFTRKFGENKSCSEHWNSSDDEDKFGGENISGSEPGKSCSRKPVPPHKMYKFDPITPDDKLIQKFRFELKGKHFPKTLSLDLPDDPKLIYVWDIIYDRSQEHGTFYRSIEGAAWTIWGWNIKRAKTSVNFHELGDKHTGERVFPRAMVHPYKLNEIRQVLDPLDETELGNQTSKIVEILKDNSTIVGFLDYETTLVPDINHLNPRQCNLIAKHLKLLLHYGKDLNFRINCLKVKFGKVPLMKNFSV